MMTVHTTYHHHYLNIPPQYITKEDSVIQPHWSTCEMDKLQMDYTVNRSKQEAAKRNAPINNHNANAENNKR